MTIAPSLLADAATPYAPLIWLAPLMRHAFGGGDMTAVTQTLLARAAAHEDDANAYLDCSIALQLSGERTLGLQMQSVALDLQTLYHLPARAAGPGLRLLVILGPGDLMANTPLDFLLEQSDVCVDMLFLRPDHPWPEQVPEHDLLLIAMAESRANAGMLQDLASLCANWPRPVLNRPEAIARLSRDSVSGWLSDQPGLYCPPTLSVERGHLQALASGHLNLETLLPGAHWPLIIRPVGSHAGQQLERLANPAALRDYLDEVSALHCYLSPFIDYRSSDGQYRKLRIVLLDGRPYIAHCAISSHWMIHYLNAGMDASAEKRAEEADTMEHFDHGFARRHHAALQTLDACAGLPYLGIDCAETADGRLLIFEIDNAMIVHAMDPPERYPYKQPAMAKLFSAFRALLERHARPV